jgi:primosomal protein N''
MSVVLASVAFWAAGQLILVGDLGKPEIVDFKARFKRLKTSERKQLESDLAEKKITDKEFLDRLLVDWDLKDKTGTAVIHSEKQREELVEDWDGFEAALVQAYFENGRKAREAAEVAKNFELPSATTT